MNDDIKQAAKAAGVHLWQIAAEIGCNDGNFSRKLRKEFSPAEKEHIFKIIDGIAR